MSSHHFVREGQEPALLIVDPLSLALVEPLLEWAPVVIVSGDAIPDVLKWKIKIDVVLLPQDAKHIHNEVLADQGPVEMLYYRHIKEIPAVVVAFLRQKKCRGVNVITTSSPDVFDRWMEQIKQLEISILDADTKWSAVVSTFQKWLPERTKLYLRSSQNSSFHCTGLKRDTEQSFLSEKNGVVSVQSDTPFWLGELLEP